MTSRPGVVYLMTVTPERRIICFMKLIGRTMTDT